MKWNYIHHQSCVSECVLPNIGVRTEPEKAFETTVVVILSCVDKTELKLCLVSFNTSKGQSDFSEKFHCCLQTS